MSLLGYFLLHQSQIPNVLPEFVYIFYLLIFFFLGGINLQDANSSSFQANNEQEHGLLVAIEGIEFFE